MGMGICPAGFEQVNPSVRGIVMYISLVFIIRLGNVVLEGFF
jgi:hypothetical protein